MVKKIIVTGGEGRFAKELKKFKSNYKFLFKNKKQLNILNLKSIDKNIKKEKPDIVLHLAGLSRPMSVHENEINRSINLNIIGTANLVKMCVEKKIKIIFFLQAMFIRVLKVITKKTILYFLGIIMDGQNLEQSLLYRCIRIL